MRRRSLTNQSYRRLSLPRDSGTNNYEFLHKIGILFFFFRHELKLICCRQDNAETQKNSKKAYFYFVIAALVHVPANKECYLSYLIPLKIAMFAA